MINWNTEKQFCSFLGLCPNNSISGGKGHIEPCAKSTTELLTPYDFAPRALLIAKALGAKYRRLKAKLGAPKAIVAMAHHLARLVYRMLRYGQNYVEKGIHHYELKFRLQRIKWLKKKPNHSTFNSLALSNFHHQFLERTKQYWQASLHSLLFAAMSQPNGIA